MIFAAACYMVALLVFLEKPLANLLFGYYYDEIECSYISDKHI